jgi:5-methylcytosine-specific restriction enzyme subunit McrC
MHIAVREHESLPVVRLRADANQRAITEHERDQLLALNDTLLKRVVEFRHRSVRFLQYCGAIQLGSLTLEVLPKIAEEDGEGGLELDRRVLIGMLSVCGKLPMLETGRASLNLQHQHILEIFIAYFCDELFRQIHHGRIREYVLTTEDTSAIRGRWRLDLEISRTPQQRTRAACEFDDLSADNPYNQAIKATLTVLRPLAHGNSELTRKVELLLTELADVRAVRMTADDVQRLPRNRLVARYETVLRMCEWFLASLSPDIRAGRENALALLFDMNVLFQEFVTTLVKRSLPEGMVARAEAPRYFLTRLVDTDDGKFQMKPDLTISRKTDGGIVAIIDTKWKWLSPQKNQYTWGVQQSDLYQMGAYASAYRCRSMALWYPSHAAIREIKLPSLEYIAQGRDSLGPRVDVGLIDLGATGAKSNWIRSLQDQVSNRLTTLLGL